MNEEAIDIAISVLEEILAGRYIKGDCDHCANVWGTLGCCSIIDNHWEYSCEEGMERYRVEEQTESSVSAEREWIPCSERLPDKQGKYIVTYEGLFDMRIDIMWYGKPTMPNEKVEGDCFYKCDDEYGDIVYDEIIAWQPLPKPYGTKMKGDTK